MPNENPFPLPFPLEMPPLPEGEIVALYTAAAADAPIVSHERVELVAGIGVKGDRYAVGKGTWSAPRYQDKQLTLVELEVAEELGMATEQLRRNIVTRGIRLPDLLGMWFRIGDTVLYGARECHPCAHIEEFNQRPGLFKALMWKGGLRAQVHQGGAIRVGDRIVADPTIWGQP